MSELTYTHLKAPPDGGCDVDGFESLSELALDLRSSWNHATDSVWIRLDPVLWNLKNNPWVVLQTAWRDKLQQAVAGLAFRKLSMIGGTINGTGALTIMAEKIGTDSMLSRIVSMVAEAQRSRAPIQGVVDAVAAWFVPAVLASATVAFAAWMIWAPAPALGLAVVAAVSVLIIA
jgi:hypothetical protein